MNKQLSRGSLIVMFLGLLVMMFGRVRGDLNEPMVLIAFSLLLLGVVLSFIALFNGEKGITKAIPALLFFTVLFYFVWTEPYSFLYMMTWLKNIF